MANGYDIVIIGAGILGLASACHLLRQDRGLNLLVLERLKGPGQGNTARSAAAYRDMFTSPVNRHLSQASLSFYEEMQDRGIDLGLRDIGYLWLLTAPQAARFAAALETMAVAGVAFEILEVPELTARLPDLTAHDLSQGVLGKRCGILNQGRLTRFYEQEVMQLGGKFTYGAEVSGFLRDGLGLIKGVRVGSQDIRAGTVIVATGAWMGETMGLAGLKAPMVPVKRQLFAVVAHGEALRRLLHPQGFNAHGLLPFTILPGGAYLRPASGAFILGYADEDRAPGLEDKPAAEAEFFRHRIRPQVARYFSPFQGVTPDYAWAGHYDCHPPDRVPFVERLDGAILVGGTSGSGIMKADALGRVAAGLYHGRDRVELGDGKYFQVAAIGLKERSLAPEGFVI
jgi:glycine/D-amino acid oxidase-like deaminating enzyme